MEAGISAISEARREKWNQHGSSVHWFLQRKVQKVKQLAIPWVGLLRCQDVAFNTRLWGLRQPHDGRAQAKLSQSVQADRKADQIQLSHFKTTNENIYTECNI